MLDTLLSRSRANMRGVQPLLVERMLDVIREAYKQGIRVQVAHDGGYRSFEEQARLYGQGRSSYIYKGRQYASAGNIVTNAPPGYSNHNFGLAVDFFLVSEDGKRGIWAGPGHALWGQWKTVANLAKQRGFKWGGDWRGFPDFPHFEDTGGLTTDQLRAGRRPDWYESEANTAGQRRPYLEVGDTGADVLRLQQLLEKAGYSPGIKDGIFGAGTERALQSFQSDAGLTQDGVYGTNSKEALEAATSEKTDAAAPTDETEVIIMFRPDSPTFRKDTIEFVERARKAGVINSADHEEALKNNEMSNSDVIGLFGSILNRLDLFNTVLRDDSAEVYPVHKEAAAWAIEHGITDGTRPTYPASRQQAWQMLYNLSELQKQQDRTGGK